MGKSRRMVSARSQFEPACQLQMFAAVAEILRRLSCKQEDAGGNPASSSRFCMAGLAEWLRRWIVAPAMRVRFSHLAPKTVVRRKRAVRIKVLLTACNRAMRVRVSHRPPSVLARELDGRVLV